MNGTIASLHRYPVKGLSPQPLNAATLSTGRNFPGDRLFAVENGPSGFDADAPAHQPKIKFLMLMRNEQLATLKTHFDEPTSVLTIQDRGREVVRADLSTRDGRLAIEAFFRRFIPHDLRGPPKVLTAPTGFRFTDSRRGFVSILNLASIAAVEKAIGKPVHPLRFRANVYVSGWPAWHEFDLIDRELTIGGARVKITQRIKRCPATNVDPETGARDLTIPDTLMQTFGHTDCGIYGEVIAGGPISIGDAIGAAQETPGP